MTTIEKSFLNANKLRSMLSKTLLMLIATSFIAMFFAFVYFYHQITQASQLTHIENADGIVVFTGDQDRLKTAFDIFGKGGASRLLISGVHKDTSMGAIKNAVGVKTENTCCIDLDRMALDTHGNATETAKWVAKHDLESLIIVTSSYHLPRSLMELQVQLPETKLLPVAAIATDKALPVARQKVTQLYLKEFIKYVAALVNLQFS